MKLDNHIAKRLLYDDELRMEIIETMVEYDKRHKGLEFEPERFAALYLMLDKKDNKSYYVTNTVIDKLDLFDNKKALSAEGWKVFETVDDFKKTFILDNNIVVRVEKRLGILYFFHLTCTKNPDPKSKYLNNIYWILFFVNLPENRIAEHFDSDDVRRVAPFIYSLMCFTLLTDNEEIEVAPGRKYGTQKIGKLINSFSETITIINSTWNVTTIRTEGFPVRGHAAFRWTGPGRSILRLVYIQPYEKEGYTRKSGKQLNEEQI